MLTSLILFIGKIRYSKVVLLQHNWPDNLHLILYGAFPRCGCVKRFAVCCGGAWRSVGEEELWSLRSSHQQLEAGSRHEHVSTERRWVRRIPTWTHQMLDFSTGGCLSPCVCAFRSVCRKQPAVRGGRRRRQLQLGLGGVLQSNHWQVDAIASLHEHRPQLCRSEKHVESQTQCDFSQVFLNPFFLYKNIWNVNYWVHTVKTTLCCN